MRADGAGPTVQEAYAACEEITRREAKNFSYGIRLLPRVKRRALCAVYALARRIDDIGDGLLSQTEKLAALEQTRTALRAGGQHPEDPVLVALCHAASVLPIPLAAFDELIDGCRADVLGTRYPTFEELEQYCRCVAGSIGRLSLGVFSAGSGADAYRLADVLGVALQITNILRDLHEDLLAGRIYLPESDREEHAATLVLGSDGRLDPQGGRLAALIRFEADRARDRYEEGLRLLPLLDRRSAACCAAMAGIYRQLLERIAADPQRVYGGRMSLGRGAKAAVAARALVWRTA